MLEHTVVVGRSVHTRYNEWRRELRERVRQRVRTGEMQEGRPWTRGYIAETGRTPAACGVLPRRAEPTNRPVELVSELSSTCGRS